MNLPDDLDRIDLKILAALQTDGRLPNQKLAEVVALSPTAVLARTQRFATTLTQVTQRYTASLASVDLRYPNGYAVRLRGVATLDDSLNPVSPR